MDDWNPPRIDLSRPRLVIRADHVWEALRDWGEHTHPSRPLGVYLVGDQLVRVSTDEATGEVKLQAMDVISLTDAIERITDCGIWVSEKVKDAHGNETTVRRWVEKDAPRNIAQNLLARSPDMLPGAARISRVVDVPVLGKKGSNPPLMTEPGYHRDAQTYFSPADGLGISSMPEWPDADRRATIQATGDHDPQAIDVTEARDFLLSVLEEFPFADSASFTHALCLMLEPFARELIGPKPTPMYAITAQLPNTGKSLLANTCLYPACGERTGLLTYTSDTDSLRKLLTSTLVAGGPSIWIDNIPQGEMLDSHVLAAALTAPNGRWDDRILGHTKMASVPIRNVWLMTANKPAISGELARRMIPIRLTVPHDSEHVFKRDLDDTWLERHRGAMVHACLTLVLNYVIGSEISTSVPHEAAVAYSPGTKNFRRSYLAWSRVMGGIMQAAYMGEFLGNLAEWEEEAAVEVQDDAAFLRQIHELALPPLRAADLLAVVQGKQTEDGHLPLVSQPIELPLKLTGVPPYKLEEAFRYWLRDTGPQGGYRVRKHSTDSPHRWTVEAIG